jgi:hypothetical protein
MMYQEPLAPEDVPALYKVTGPNGEPLHGGSGTWPLPTADGPGEWWDIPGEVQGCRSGLHLTDREHLMSWVPNAGDPIVWRAEVRGPLYRVGSGDKYVAGSVRLLPRKPRKGPDHATMRARRDRAVARARRAMDRADAALARDAGAGWAAYAATPGIRDDVIHVLPGAGARRPGGMARGEARRRGGRHCRPRAVRCGRDGRHDAGLTGRRA